MNLGITMIRKETMQDKITVIMQARMNSSRLPGKVLMEVMGRPLLSYQIERMRFSKKIDEIIIATTTNLEDDAVANLAVSEQVQCFRGDEHDVLDRYYQAATAFQAKHIMRLTGDCPLIDPEICDQLVVNYQSVDVDLVHTGPTFAEGTDSELFSFRGLESAWKNAKLLSEREHCTLYLHNHQDQYTIRTLINSTDDSRYRFTVDCYADFLVIKAIIEALYSPGDLFRTSDIKQFLDTHKEIIMINAAIERNEGLKKSLREDRKIDST